MYRLKMVWQNVTHNELVAVFSLRRQSPTLKRTLSEEMMLNIGEVERPAMKAGGTGDTEELMAKNPFYSLLGDCYTIVVSRSD